MLPISHNNELSLLDAFFTSTSAVCVTGLIVKDTATDFTLFGQFIIITLVQIGGVGYLAFATFAIIVFGKQITHRDYAMLKASASYNSAKGVLIFLKQTVGFILILEITCALILTISFNETMPLIDAAWAGIFHSIAAFNNSGFSTFQNNLIDYRQDVIVVFIVTFLVIFGGIGYITLYDIYNYNKKQVTRLSLHSKITIWATIFLLIAAFFLFITLEWGNHKTIGNFTVYEKIVASYFYSVNLRSSGFNIIDLASITDSTIFLSTLFMAIGGGIGGTAGGIKVTVFAIVILTMWHSLKGHNSIFAFKRTIPIKTVMQATTTIYVATFYFVMSTILLAITQDEPFLRVLFEVVSAFGTVGISTGNGGTLSLSASFDEFGKINIIILMIMGRIGILAFTLILVGKIADRKFKYPEGRILI